VVWAWHCSVGVLVTVVMFSGLGLFCRGVRAAMHCLLLCCSVVSGRRWALGPCSPNCQYCQDWRAFPDCVKTGGNFTLPTPHPPDPHHEHVLGNCSCTCCGGWGCGVGLALFSRCLGRLCGVQRSLPLSIVEYRLQCITCCSVGVLGIGCSWAIGFRSGV
jgi:hypothetical protein